MITFVTGVSCAGKTTVGHHLADAVEVRDLDEDAPARASTAWLDWLRWRAAEELHRAIEVEHDVVVTGIVWPVRLIESPAWRPARRAGVLARFVLLDPPWRLLRERLKVRTVGESRSERAELVRYNRELRPVLREQVRAVRNGQVSKSSNLAGLRELILKDWSDDG